jgi:hypothetical protein
MVVDPPGTSCGGVNERSAEVPRYQQCETRGHVDLRPLPLHRQSRGLLRGPLVWGCLSLADQLWDTQWTQQCQSV